MDDKLLATIIGIGSGAAGYFISTFWMRPILHYRELRTKVFADLIFYAQVINADGLSERMQKLHEERVLAARRSSAEFAACVVDLPSLYHWYLRRRGQSPARVSEDLMGYSNTIDYEKADNRIERIKKNLGIKSDLP